MKTILILVYPDVAIGHVSGMAEIFRYANQLAAFLTPGAAPPYQVLFYQLTAAGTSADTAPCDGAAWQDSAASPDGAGSYQTELFRLNCVNRLPPQIDAVLVPGNYLHHRAGLAQLQASFQGYRAWFNALLAQNCWLGAACNGTFALAATGVLDDGPATTCWFLADYFRQQFPHVQLDATATVSRHGRCLTAGATTAYLQLCLQLIREFDGARFSNQLAKILLVEPALHGQAPFLSVQQLIGHQDERVGAVQQYLQQNLAQPVDLQALAARFAMSSRTLIRRFKAATGDTPMAWLQKLRIDKAKLLLESTQLPLEQLTMQVGYEDVSSFRKLFQQYTRMTPKAYRAQFSQG